MTLTRILEPEVMDSAKEAREYNDMDHGEVNRLFVTDLLAQLAIAGAGPPSDIGVLDVGTGTALIPIELCRRHAGCRVIAIDLAVHMLELGRYNVEAASLIDRIELAKVDAKSMGYESGYFDAAISNSIVHHIPEPLACLQQMVRVTRHGGTLFVRDLMRPADQSTLDQLVTTYAGQESEYSQKLFRDSLHAALSLQEIRELVAACGGDPESVNATSDRHWTWAAIKEPA